MARVPEASLGLGVPSSREESHLDVWAVFSRFGTFEKLAFEDWRSEGISIGANKSWGIISQMGGRWRIGTQLQYCSVLWLPSSEEN